MIVGLEIHNGVAKRKTIVGTNIMEVINHSIKPHSKTLSHMVAQRHQFTKNMIYTLQAAFVTIKNNKKHNGSFVDVCHMTPILKYIKDIDDILSNLY